MDLEEQIINWLIFGGRMPNLAQGVKEVRYPRGFEPNQEGEGTA